jgi:proteasome lid subunit RPN8/RPN11
MTHRTYETVAPSARREWGPDEPELVIEITPDARARLEEYARLCPLEISGLGMIEVQLAPEAGLVITEVVLLDQEVTHTHTTLSGEALALFMMGLDDRDANPESVRVWWHSHAHMRAFFSDEDEATIGSFSYLPWLVSIVTNHYGEMLARLDLFPSELVPVHVTKYARLVTQRDFSLAARLRAEIQRRVTKVTEPVPAVMALAARVDALGEGANPNGASSADTESH